MWIWLGSGVWVLVEEVLVDLLKDETTVDMVFYSWLTLSCSAVEESLLFSRTLFESSWCFLQDQWYVICGHTSQQRKTAGCWLAVGFMWKVESTHLSSEFLLQLTLCCPPCCTPYILFWLCKQDDLAIWVPEIESSTESDSTKMDGLLVVVEVVVAGTSSGKGWEQIFIFLASASLSTSGPPVLFLIIWTCPNPGQQAKKSDPNYPHEQGNSFLPLWLILILCLLVEVLIYALTNRANTIVLALFVRAYINKSVVLLVRIFYRASRPDHMVCVSPRPNDPFTIYLTGTNRISSIG